MQHLFYIMTAFFILFEAICLANAKRIQNKRKQLKQKKEGEKINISSTHKLFILICLSYFTWAVIGLMSSQWLLFAALFIIGFIPNKWLFFRYIDHSVSILILVFVILNKYHLHIDLFSILFN